jgi:sporulation protein YlmC with PRC-barrel domain
MFKRSALSSAIVLAGSVWGSAALANVESGAQFSSAADITKVSEWMGKDVHDNEGNEIGEISDFALNLEDGSIVYAVVDLGGMFSTKAIAVPVSSLSSSPDNGDELTLQVSHSEWKGAETFSGSDWPLKASLGTGTGALVSQTTTEASSSESTDTQWQQSEDRYDQDSQSTGSVSSFDRDVEFDNLDTDGDGYITVEEYKDAKGSEATVGIDKDDDDRISRSEFAAFEKQREQGSMKQRESSTYERHGDSDAERSYDSQDDAYDVETDD